jgi:hypothetical protein
MEEKTEKILTIWKKIVKRFGKYEKKVSLRVERFGKYGRKV